MDPAPARINAAKRPSVDREKVRQASSKHMINKKVDTRGLSICVNTRSKKCWSGTVGKRASMTDEVCLGYPPTTT